jgi:hypothetical protein
MLIVAQWFALTLALGASLVRTEQTFAGLIDPRFDSSTSFLVAAGAAALLGITIVRPWALMAAATLLCIGAVALFVLMLYIPVWDGTVLRTRALDNFAINRSLILALLLAFPIALGAVVGLVLGALLDRRHEVLSSTKEDIA